MNSTDHLLKIEDEYAWTFFGRSREYYLELWQLRQQGKYVHFNIAAFFFGVFWFAYRRMYFVLFLLVAVLLAEAMLEQALLGEARGQGRTILVGLVQASVLGAFGNTLYLWDAERKMRKILRRAIPKDDILALLRRAGGTSWWFVPVVLAIGGLYGWLLQWVAWQSAL
ncbi:DUF2628 domain-containing protein [Hymenobacter sediminicola]|uniref:DUF2628 domain-containing protein n=1 Tax=Hymenobacter sediminicola TaxID=2761579 RepID=A0A7G7WBF3_9BACT|nr:DUF2628 domain-containing protein [Hymenobacter sediminicola]QNH63696.1 DUF2628 domain-containing protein [Hymenobacter sediminicola]